MNGYSNSCKPRKVGVALIDPESAHARRAIPLLTDTSAAALKCRALAGAAEQNGARRFRLKGPAIESISCNTEIDATDSLDHLDQNPNAVAFGIALELAAMEGPVNPPTSELSPLNVPSRSSALKVMPLEPRSYRVNGCNPGRSKPAAPPSQRSKKIGG